MSCHLKVNNDWIVHGAGAVVAVICSAACTGALQLLKMRALLTQDAALLVEMLQYRSEVVICSAVRTGAL